MTSRIALAFLLSAAACGAAVSGDAFAAATVSKTLTKCQGAIATAATKVFDARAKGLDKCANGVLKCVLVKPNDPQCIPAVQKVCATKLPDSGGEAQKFADALLGACGTLPPETLSAADGLGLGPVLSGCGAIPPGTFEKLASCLTGRASATAQHVLGLEVPRARELVALGGVDPATQPELPAIDGCGVCDGTVPENVGLAVTKCESSVAAAGRKFAEAALGALRKCVSTGISCVVTNDVTCRAAAAKACAATLRKLPAARDKLTATIAKSCDESLVQYAVFRSQRGANVDAVAATCSSLGLGDLDSAAAYGRCLRQQHECETRDLVSATAPRADEVLTSVGMPLASVLCLPVCTTEGSAPESAFDQKEAFTLPTGIRRFVELVRTGTARGTYRPGGVPVTRGAPNRVQASGSGSPSPGSTLRYRVRYVRGGINTGSVRSEISAASSAEDATPPALLVAVRRMDGTFVSDFFEVPLDAEEGSTDVDVTFAATMPSCLFQLAFSTRIDGVVGEPALIEEVPAPPNVVGECSVSCTSECNLDQQDCANSAKIEQVVELLSCTEDSNFNCSFIKAAASTECAGLCGVDKSECQASFTEELNDCKASLKECKDAAKQELDSTLASCAEDLTDCIAACQ